MIDKNKSVSSSQAGSKLVTISGVVLLSGIVAAIIIFVTAFRSNGYETRVDWNGIASTIEVLFGSIFIYSFGKTIAKIADYAEAIYKQQNPDNEYDRAIEAGARFMPGDRAIYNLGQEDEAKVTVKDLTYDGEFHYKCVLPNGKEAVISNLQLFEMDEE